MTISESQRYWAWKYARRYEKLAIPYGLEYDDLLNEARLAAWQAEQTYDETKGTFEYWVFGAIRYHLKHHCWMKLQRHKRNQGEELPTIFNEQEHIIAFVDASLLDVEDEVIQESLLEQCDRTTGQVLRARLSGKGWLEIQKENQLTDGELRRIRRRLQSEYGKIATR